MCQITERGTCLPFSIVKLLYLSFFLTVDEAVLEKSNSNCMDLTRKIRLNIIREKDEGDR